MNASLHKKGNMYYAVISVPAGNGKFKTKWISTHCRKKGDATKAMREILTRMENGMFEQTCPYTFMEYMDYWLKSVIKPQIEVTTYEGYVSNYKLHILPYFQPLNLKLDQLRVGHFQQFVNDLHHHGRKDGEGGLSTASIRKYMGNITKALNHAIRIGWLTQNPASYVEYPRSKPFVGSFYTTDEIERLLDAVRGQAIETPIILATHYGLRRGEILGLRWCDIDFEENTISIVNTRVRVSTDVEKQPKNEASRRTFPLIASVKEHLLKVKAQQEENRRVMREAYVDSDYVYVWDNGQLPDIGYLNRALTKVLKANGLRHIRLHDLRHSTASYLNKLGFTPKEIQIWLGHSDISTTMNIYTHIDIGMKVGIAEKINTLFGDKIAG